MTGGSLYLDVLYAINAIGRVRLKEVGTRKFVLSIIFRSLPVPLVEGESVVTNVEGVCGLPQGSALAGQPIDNSGVAMTRHPPPPPGRRPFPTTLISGMNGKWVHAKHPRSLLRSRAVKSGEINPFWSPLNLLRALGLPKAPSTAMHADPNSSVHALECFLMSTIRFPNSRYPRLCYLG